MASATYMIDFRARLTQNWEFHLVGMLEVALHLSIHFTSKKLDSRIIRQIFT